MLGAKCKTIYNPILILLSVLVLFISCSKSNIYKGSGSINISFQGISNEENKILSSNQALNRSAPQSLNIPIDDTRELVIDIKPESYDYNNSPPKLLGSTNNTRDTVEIPNGTKFYYAVYKTTGEYVFHRDTVYISGRSYRPISLPAGDYKIIFLAATGNNLPLIDFRKPLKDVSINNFSAANIDLMYFEKLVSVDGESDQNVQVLFRHKLSKLTVSLDASAMGTVNSFGQLRISNTYDFFNLSLDDGGEISPNGNVSDRTISLTSSSNKLATNSFLLFSGGNLANLTFLDVNIEGVTKNVNMPSLLFDSGIRYTLEFRLSKVIEPSGSNVIWAPGNLVYNSGNHLFASHQGIAGDKWRLNTYDIFPAQGSGEKTVLLDPCTKVLSFGGGWRLPTASEYSAIMSTHFVRNWSLGEAGKAKYPRNNAYGVYFGTPRLTANPSNLDQVDDYLFLPRAGAYHENGSFLSEQGNYWTSTAVLSGDNHYFLQFAENYITETLDHTYYERGNSIRCVKSK